MIAELISISQNEKIISSGGYDKCHVRVSFSNCMRLAADRLVDQRRERNRRNPSRTYRQTKNDYACLPETNFCAFLVEKCL